MATLQKLTRVSMLVKRNPNITEEEFHKQWSKIRGPLVAPFLKRIGFTKYLQILVPSSIKEEVLQLGGPQFDGFVDFLAPTFEAFLAAFEALFYDERFKSEEEYLIDPAATVIINAGYEEVYLFGAIGGGFVQC